MSIKLSCCTLGYTRTTTVEDAIKRIAKIGYEGVDLYTGPPHLWPGDYGKEERKAVRDLIEKLNLKLTGFAVGGGGLALQYNFGNPRLSLRKLTLQYYLDNIELAHEMGCPLFNVLTGHVLHGTTRDQARKWTMEALQQLFAFAG